MKTYSVKYECINCGTFLYKEIEFGKTIPILLNKKSHEEQNKTIWKFGELAPSCEYCGCNNYRNGKKA